MKKLKQEERDKITSERIKKIREMRGLTQKELASEINVSRESLANYESRRHIDLDILLEIANFFEISLDYLLGRTESISLDTSVKIIVDKTNLTEKSIEILEELKKYSPDVIDTINYLIEQEEFFPISSFSYTEPKGATEKSKEKLEQLAEERYNKAEEYWIKTHCKILSKISNFYDVKMADKMLYITDDAIKTKEDFKSYFEKMKQTKAEVSLENLVETTLLSEIEYQLKNSKINKAENKEQNKKNRKYINSCNIIKNVKLKEDTKK